jgi:DNA excision repair protein ERCC-3
MIVQGDKTALLEVNSERYAEARDILARFAELEKSPEYIHTYRITPLSLWNAASSGLQAADIIDGLNEFAKYPVPGNVIQDIQEYIDRYGCVKLVQEGDDLHLISDDAHLIRELMEHKAFRAYIVDVVSPTRLAVHPVMRGHIKQVLVQIGYPAEDLAGYVNGDALTFQLRADSTVRPRRGS